MPDGVEIRPLTPHDWSQLETLFGPRGACGGCWCMLWRVPSTGRYWDDNKGAPNRDAFRRLVSSGQANGLLAFRADLPIGWCGLGPREDFPYLSRARQIGPPPSDHTWSVTCFFVRRDERRIGIASELLREAVRYAREWGADCIEGYPYDASGREAAPDAFVHTGTCSIFRANDFVLAATAGRRMIYRLSLA